MENVTVEKNNMKKPKKSKKHRYGELVTNLDSLAVILKCDIEDVIETFKDLLDSIGVIENYAFAVHDKDYDYLEEMMKKPHIHCVMHFKQPVEFKNIANKIGIAPSFISTVKQKKPVGSRWWADVGGALAYLTHRNDKEKVQYPDDIVVSSDGWDWLAERNKSEEIQAGNNLEIIMQGIQEGLITKSNMAEHIDMHMFVSNRGKIENAFEYQRKVDINEHSRDMTCVFISGISGTGKTLLAQQYCKNKKISYFVSGSGNDPFQDYGGQIAVILDDVRPKVFSGEDWLKIMDNHTGSQVKARYHNVWLNAKYLFICSSLSISDFFEKSFKKEDVTQFYRRIKYLFVMDKEIVRSYRFMYSQKKFELTRVFKNPFQEFIDAADCTVEEFDEFVEGFELEPIDNDVKS